MREYLKRIRDSQEPMAAGAETRSESTELPGVENAASIQAPNGGTEVTIMTQTPGGGGFDLKTDVSTNGVNWYRRPDLDEQVGADVSTSFPATIAAEYIRCWADGATDGDLDRIGVTVKGL